MLDGFERLAAGQCDEPFAGVVSKKALVEQVAGRLHLCPHLLTQLQQRERSTCRVSQPAFEDLQDTLVPGDAVGHAGALRDLAHVVEIPLVGADQRLGVAVRACQPSAASIFSVETNESLSAVP